MRPWKWGVRFCYNRNSQKRAREQSNLQKNYSRMILITQRWTIIDKIAVLILFYNEELTITKVVTDFRTSFLDAVINVYDNNSTDNSVSLATVVVAIVRYEYHQWKGNVIR